MTLEGHGPSVNQQIDPSACVFAGWDSWRELSGPSGHEQESLVSGTSSGNRGDKMT